MDGPTEPSPRPTPPARPAPTAPARAVTYAVVAALAAVALRRDPPHPRRPAEVLVRQSVMAPAWVEAVDTLERSALLGRVLDARGVAAADLPAAVRDRRVTAGVAVTVRERTGDGSPSAVVVELAPDHLLRLERADSGWTAAEEHLPWTTDSVVVEGTVRSTLAAALADAASDVPRALRTELAYTLADIYEYRVDMSRDLQPGDPVRVLVERSRGPGGMVRLGRVLAATVGVGGREIEAVRFSSADASGEYFDESGRSLRAHFLRAPLAFRRISSSFGRRLHPILGVWRQHKGLDYAAAAGTPVRAVGDGVVIKAGWGGGYGNVVEVRLRNGYVTRYGHLRGFARGVRRGSRVEVGQTLAFVGTTGLSTAPHLHFEMLVNGVNRDPRVALRALKGGEPIAGRELASFEQVRTRLLAALERPRLPAGAATATITD